MAIEAKKRMYSLTQFEEAVLNAIKKLLKKHLVFQFDDTFITFCRRKLKASEIEIYGAMYSLIQKKLIMPGSTLTREQILENPSRTSIFRTIQTHPGIHIRELCTKLKKKSGEVIIVHLRVLENFNFIRRKIYSAPKFTLFFQSNFPETYDDFFIAWKNKNAQGIIQLLVKEELTLTELSSRLNLHHSTIQYHLEKLKQLNMVIRIQKNQTFTYTFNKTRLEIFMEFLEEYSP